MSNVEQEDQHTSIQIEQRARQRDLAISTTAHVNQVHQTMKSEFEFE